MEGRTGPGGPRVAVLKPQTYMNEAGRSVGPARGVMRLPLERVLVVHDEIDLPFGEVRVRLGGGLAGHNGLRSLKRELGGADFHRVRVGVGRPDSTDPDIVAAYVLGRWREPPDAVAALVDRAADEAERLVLSG
jgi:PTH1 family peptidyl-tRNA hydrolase